MYHFLLLLHPAASHVMINYSVTAAALVQRQDSVLHYQLNIILLNLYLITTVLMLSSSIAALHVTYGNIHSGALR